MNTRQVRMRTSYAGPSGNVGPGEVGTFPADEAASLVGGGFGDYVDREPQPIETAEAPPAPEVAVSERGRMGRLRGGGRRG